MKKIYSLILLVTVAFSAKAQYTLTSANNAVIGEIEKTWPADTLTPNGLYPAGGTNQIWNYSGIIISPTVSAVSNSYVAVSAAPNASLFSAANIAKTSDNINYELSNNSATSITSYGSSNSSVTIVYQNPELIATLPFTYGTLCTDTYSASYTSNSIPVSRTGTVTTSGDGTGTLNMPGNKNYTNALRVKLQLKQIENFGSAGSQTITVKAYVYFNAASKFSLLSVNVYTVNQISGTTTATFYGKSIDVGDVLFAGIKENTNAANFNIYPNPSSNKEVSVQFNTTANENYELTIYNALGQQVKALHYSNLPLGDQSEKISLSELNSGLYTIKLKSKNHESTKKLVVD
ncbi:MAG: T9SS type A sorting domain-containing protein [Bacteroidetes bacterium]|nr:T9SS type A sorting domain-containing protein [Bacteroidota bacterium]